jgi:hypothetical protein
MKRFHVHVAVVDLNEAVGFYSTLFDAQPSVIKNDYAKWMLEDPRVNFAISVRGAVPGLDHLGIQVDSANDLQQIAGRLVAAGRSVLEQKNEACCYATGDKGWTADPSGISWETFHTFGEITEYGRDTARTAPAATSASACCGAAKA